MDNHLEAARTLSASPRIFENPLLDKLSRVHHLMPLLVYSPVIVILLALGCAHFHAPTMVAGVVAGYVTWTLAEYWGHRYLFHFEFPGRFGARIHFLIHGVHHDYPSDPLRLVMPPLLSGPIMIVAFGLLRLACGPDLVLPVLAGFIAGYLGYDMLHFYVHNGHVHKWRPVSRIARALRRRHMAHHFREPGRCFGVSAPWWDHVFGTAPAAATADSTRK